MRTTDGCCYHGFIDGIRRLVWKDAGGQAGDDPDHADFMCCLQHVVIDEDIVSLERTDTSVSTNTNDDTEDKQSLLSTQLFLFAVITVQLPHTQKSRLHLMFLNSPPTMAAR